MTTRSIFEAAQVVSAPTEESNGTWRVRLINEGRGSSGVYSADLLENYGHAFNGAISFLNHPTSGPESRNFTEIVGRVVGETWTERDENGLLGVYANWEPDEDYKRKLEKYRENLGLSIYISGNGEEDENGDFRVTEFDATDPFRSVDVVIAAGRGGRFEESLKKIYEHRNDADLDDKPGVTSAQENDRKEIMDEKLDKLIDMIGLLVAKDEARAAEAAQVEADEAAVATAVEQYDAAVKAIDEADLLPSQVASLRAEAKKGADVAPLIEAAKKVKEDALTVLSEDAGHGGRVITTNTDVEFRGFGGKR